jgi:glyceraldehyde 3-phosphate dehydrogenase
MVTTVGIMGFGRIGRNVFRLLYKRDDVRIAAICDTADPASVEYLLKFDTLSGRFPDLVTVKDGSLYVYGRQVALLANYEKGAIPDWKALGVDLVIDATNRRQGRADVTKHLAAGARRVLLSALPSDPLDQMAVMGVTDHLLRPEHRLVSVASPTVHCVAPLVKILLEAFGIDRLMFTTVHEYTSHHNLADVPAEDMRQGRSAPENIIPQESRSPAILMKLFPELAGRVLGAAMNVPVPNGSAVDLVCWHERKVTVDAVNEVVRTAAASRWKGLLEFVDEPIVSSDIAHSSFSGSYDSKATMVLGERLSKTLTWFDSGWAYAHRLVELMDRFRILDREAHS